MIIVRHLFYFLIRSQNDTKVDSEHLDTKLQKSAVEGVPLKSHRSGRLATSVNKSIRSRVMETETVHVHIMLSDAMDVTPLAPPQRQNRFFCNTPLIDRHHNTEMNSTHVVNTITYL